MPLGASMGGGKKKNKYMPKAVAFVQGKADVPINDQVKLGISEKESEGSDAEAIQDYIQVCGGGKTGIGHCGVESG